MLIKEYRIPLPMSVEEYRIAQLYMIQRKSREESHGEGSGVEIITNEPYEDGPGGKGQYTYKIYHVGSHLPGWFRAILPKSALRVEEEAWNAYPYTKTRYRCPFVEKLYLEIETRYLNDAGEEDNVFNLSPSELKNRVIDYLDIVKDPISSGDYKKEEDPKIYKSQKTGRGPLTDNWRAEYAREAKLPGNNKCIMTAYKLCRVEFKYWGMQNKIERFIHDIGLRKTMLRAHRQAWCWQDEYYGLKLSDIRRLELETQLALAEKMKITSEEEAEEENETEVKETPKIPISTSFDQAAAIKRQASDPDYQGKITPESRKPSSGTIHKRSLSGSTKHKGGSFHDISTSRMFESLEQLQESSSEDEEFFDAKGHLTPCDESEFWSDEGSDSAPNSDEEEKQDTRSELVTSGDEYADARSNMSEDQIDTSLVKKMEHFRQQHFNVEQNKEISPPSSAGCKTNILFLVLHGGNLLDMHIDHVQASKRSDFSTIKSTFEQVMRTHYPGAVGHIAFRLVSCPQICTDTVNLLASLSPYGYDSQTPKSQDASFWTQDFVPLGAIAMFASSNPEYHESVNKMVAKANLVYQDFLSSGEGKGFNGQVCLLADSTGSLMAYDALTMPGLHYGRGLSTYDSNNSLNESNPRCSIVRTSDSSHQLSLSDPDLSKCCEIKDCVCNTVMSDKQLSKSDTLSTDYKLRRQNSAQRQSGTHLHVNEHPEHVRRTSTGSNFDGTYLKLDFEVSEFFMLGAPLGLVLAYRRMTMGDDAPPQSPMCNQVYNLFHSSDPAAVRLEPLIHDSFKLIPPVKISRYNKFPLGNGEPIHVVETVQSNLNLFTNRRCSSGPPLQRQGSITSNISQMSGLGESTVSFITNVTSRWWGNKRVDYVLYCPEVLHTFPISALPHLFHASFWESSDVTSFILRQVLRYDASLCEHIDDELDLQSSLIGKSAREKWLKRRTTIKVKNLHPNHRGNDVMVLEDKPQVITARFMYGSFDVTSLSGEKVDVHVMDQLNGEWQYMGTDVTDKNGKLQFTIPASKSLPQGMHPVKVVVRGDHSSADFYLCVLPPKTETVVFSIDGSFTASMSISGKDPKVRPGAVDVVRHWQEHGYLILYVTARPDMQHKKVVSWLAMHNFPHGMVAFMDGLSKEPLKQKLAYLKSLQSEAQLLFKAGYGSNKDIYVYKELGLTPQQIYIVGKSSRKHMSHAQVLSEGYAAHLSDLRAPGTTRQAVGNARLFIQKGVFTKTFKSEGKKALKRVSSNPTPAGDFVNKHDGHLHTTISVAPEGHTIIQQGGATSNRTRGTSPKTKITLKDVPR
ncbi:protein retinal degeneration B-like isoform X2 [Saccostrea echinata]|uniref:protein retinal degeneration B-like isoform X2 n=1 Tax=Saccostrea echinata TaxID=191078 RepID=UPI002A806587|nr:protein retinal degeneration B-like isoform X2 [Saccostrea echinata]